MQNFYSARQFLLLQWWKKELWNVIFTCPQEPGGMEIPESFTVGNNGSEIIQRRLKRCHILFVNKVLEQKISTFAINFIFKHHFFRVFSYSITSKPPRKHSCSACKSTWKVDFPMKRYFPNNERSTPSGSSPTVPLTIVSMCPAG